VSIILEYMKKNNEEAKKKFPRGKRVVISTSEIRGEGVVIDMWEARSIDEFFPTIYVRLKDGKEVAVPSIAVSPVEEVKEECC